MSVPLFIMAAESPELNKNSILLYFGDEVVIVLFDSSSGEVVISERR